MLFIDGKKDTEISRAETLQTTELVSEEYKAAPLILDWVHSAYVKP
jgi:hypothetical protein